MEFHSETRHIHTDTAKRSKENANVEANRVIIELLVKIDKRLDRIEEILAE